MNATTKIIITLVTLIASSAYGCDEACKKAEAESKHKIEFPGYLSWKFCDETRIDFITSDMGSLENYSSKHFDTRYKGGMRNIKKFLEQRISWLQECNQYMSMTGKGHIFENAKTTKAIFASMKAVSKELGDLINGVTYSSELGDGTSAVMKEKFEKLITKVDDHKNLMALRGDLVYR